MFTINDNDTKPLSLEVQKSKIRSQRAFITSQFVDEINLERPCVYLKDGKKKTLGKVTGRAIAMKVSHLKELSELYFLMSICRDTRNRGGSFSKRFFTEIKSYEK